MCAVGRGQDVLLALSRLGDVGAVHTGRVAPAPLIRERDRLRSAPAPRVCGQHLAGYDRPGDRGAALVLRRRRCGAGRSRDEQRRRRRRGDYEPPRPLNRERVCRMRMATPPSWLCREKLPGRFASSRVHFPGVRGLRSRSVKPAQEVRYQFVSTDDHKRFVVERALSADPRDHVGDHRMGAVVAGRGGPRPGARAARSRRPRRRSGTGRSCP